VTPEQRSELREFILGFPEEGRDLIYDWPPGCTVRTRPGVMLLVPAPDVEGEVVSYFESGQLGVAAPLTIPHPVYGWGSGTAGELARAMVDPADLEFVREGAVTRDDVREATS
jgi:hypothetical protein